MRLYLQTPSVIYPRLCVHVCVPIPAYYMRFAISNTDSLHLAWKRPLCDLGHELFPAAVMMMVDFPYCCILISKYISQGLPFDGP